MFAVIDFGNDLGSAIIPCSWYLNNDKELCYWPPSNAMKHAERETTPSTSWKIYSVRELGLAATFQRAKDKLEQSQYTSDLQSGSDSGDIRRKRKLRPRLSDSSDSEEHIPEKRINLQKSLTLPLPTPPCRQVIASESATPTSRTPTCYAVSPGASTSRDTSSQARQLSTSSSLLQELSFEACRDAAFQEKVIKILVDLMEGQKTILNIVSKGRRDEIEGGSKPTPPKEINLPIPTMLDFDFLEALLSSGGDTYTEMETFLVSIGGFTLQRNISRVMCTLITPNLASQFNMKGYERHGKRGIACTKLYEVVCGAIRRNKSFDFPTDAELEVAMAKFLSNARDIGGKKNRKSSN